MPATTYDVSARGNKFTTDVDLTKGTKKAHAELRRMASKGQPRIIDVTITADHDNPIGSLGRNATERSESEPTFSVLWRGMRIGALWTWDREDFHQLTRITGSGLSASTVAQVKPAPASSPDPAKVTLSLREPDVLVPTNEPPMENWVLMPSGKMIQVLNEEEHAAFLRTFLGSGDRCQILATLHVATFGVRSKFKAVVVHVDGKRIGNLSKPMSEKVLPAVEHFEALGCVTATRALINASSGTPQVTLECARAADLSNADLKPVISPLPRLSGNDDAGGPIRGGEANRNGGNAHPENTSSAARSATTEPKTSASKQRQPFGSAPIPAPTSPFTNPFAEVDTNFPTGASSPSAYSNVFGAGPGDNSEANGSRNTGFGPPVMPFRSSPSAAANRRGGSPKRIHSATYRAPKAASAAKRSSVLKVAAGSLGLVFVGVLGLGILGQSSAQEKGASTGSTVTVTETSTISQPTSSTTSSSITSSTSTSSSGATSSTSATPTAPRTSEPAYAADVDTRVDVDRPYLPVPDEPRPTTVNPAPQQAYSPPSNNTGGGGGVYYANCAAARAAGAAPIPAGAPGYRPALDRDNDGWACEV